MPAAVATTKTAVAAATAASATRARIHDSMHPGMWTHSRRGGSGFACPLLSSLPLRGARTHCRRQHSNGSSSSSSSRFSRCLGSAVRASADVQVEDTVGNEEPQQDAQSSSCPFAGLMGSNNTSSSSDKEEPQHSSLEQDLSGEPQYLEQAYFL